MTDEELEMLRELRHYYGKFSVRVPSATIVTLYEFDALIARLEAAEAVVEAVAKFHTPDYASTAWQVRTDTRAALAAWRRAAGKEG